MTAKEAIIHTFCKELDDTLLYGGIYTTQLTYVVGENYSGKTNFCMQLLIDVQFPEICGGINSNSICIYPTLFVPNRLEEIAKLSLEELNEIITKLHQSSLTELLKSYSVESLLSKVFLREITNKAELVSTAQHLHELISRNDIRLVVIENISTLIKYFETKEAREIFLRRFLAHLHELAYVSNVAVVITNTLDSKTYTGQLIDHILTEVCNVKLFLAQNEGSRFKATILKTPFDSNRADIMQDFQIARRGVRSVL